MTYELEYPDRVLERLGDEYMSARRAGASTVFTAALDRIERAMSADPLACGESRGSSLRLAIDLPVTVLFEANHVRKTVLIHDVRFVSRAKS